MFEVLKDDSRHKNQEDAPSRKVETWEVGRHDKNSPSRGQNLKERASIELVA